MAEPTDQRQPLEPNETSSEMSAPEDRPTQIEDPSTPQPENERVADLLAHTIDVPVLAEAVERQDAPDAADTLENLEEDDAADVLKAMQDNAAAEALAEMQQPLAALAFEDLVDDGEVAYAAGLLQLMAPDDAADLLQAIDDEAADAVLLEMPPSRAVALRRLTGYGEETAAGLMTTDYRAFRSDQTVAEVTDRIRADGLPEDMHDLPVIDERGRLVGLLELRLLIVSPVATAIAELMSTTVKAVHADLDREQVAREFDRYDHYMLPVVDRHDRLLGVVTVDDVIDIIRAEQTEDVQKTVGAGAGESVYSSAVEKIRGRFPWLVVSSIIMVPAAWVVLQFEGTIAELPILAVLMPVVAALAGNAGHQALAVTLRGIVLEEVRPERVWPLLRREIAVGVLTGAALGLGVAIVVTLGAMLTASVSVDAGWRLGVVVAISMAVSMGAGALAGTAVPLLMLRVRADPAQSSAIFLIMITDAVAFTTFLGLAATLRGWLV